jgi:hypothetical protein
LRVTTLITVVVLCVVHAPEFVCGAVAIAIPGASLEPLLRKFIK